MHDMTKIPRILSITIVFIILSAVLWFTEIFINPSNSEFILAAAAVPCSFTTICLISCCAAKAINKRVSLYRIFAITDIVMGVAAAVYAVYDMNTATGWFAGLWGLLILMAVIPIAVLLLITDFIVWVLKRKTDRTEYNYSLLYIWLCDRLII